MADRKRASLLASAAAGDEVAFRRIIAENHDSMRRVAAHVTGDGALAEEATQAAWLIAGAIVALFGGFLLSGVLTQEPSQGSPGVGASSPSASPQALPASARPDSIDRRSLAVAGVPLSFDRPASSGEPWQWAPLKDDLYISRDTSGSQAAEAMILWTAFPGSQHARPCLLDPSASSTRELAASVATAAGTELVSGPADVTVGGRAAKQVVVKVAPDAFLEEVTGGARTGTVGCNPGYFFGWEADDTGAFWQETLPGDTIKVWVVGIAGEMLFIEAATHPEAGAAVQQEIDGIIDSIRFE